MSKDGDGGGWCSLHVKLLRQLFEDLDHFKL